MRAELALHEVGLAFAAQGDEDVGPALLLLRRREGGEEADLCDFKVFVHLVQQKLLDCGGRLQLLALERQISEHALIFSHAFEDVRCVSSLLRALLKGVFPLIDVGHVVGLRKRHGLQFLGNALRAHIEVGQVVDVLHLLLGYWLVAALRCSKRGGSFEFRGNAVVRLVVSALRERSEAAICEAATL